MRLVLLGDPVDHSRSPDMHQAALDATGIGGRYDARRVDEEGLMAALAEVRRGDLDGANVTMPHKALAARLVDTASPEAERARAVNTVSRPVGKALVGDNTDVVGIRDAAVGAGLPPEGPVLVLGAGGAAAAAVLAFEGRPLRVAARRPEAARSLIDRLRVNGEAADWGDPWREATVVNATPIGMASEALPTGLVEVAAGLLDMVYGAEPTAAVSEARARGLPAADGLEVLVAQGAASFFIWTGRPAPREAMLSALRNHRMG